jgi:hypothetical protein
MVRFSDVQVLIFVAQNVHVGITVYTYEKLFRG